MMPMMQAAMAFLSGRAQAKQYLASEALRENEQRRKFDAALNEREEKL